MKLKNILTASAIFGLIAFDLNPTQAGLFGPKGDNPEEKRAQVLQARANALQQLYAEKPETREKIANAPGYAVFDNKNIHLFLLSSGNGYGVAVNNKTGQNTFMRMASLGGGFGVGLRDFRAIFIFKNAAALQKFIDVGLQFGGQGDIAVKGGGGGVAASEGVVVNPDMDIYQITEKGIALQATIQGTKYWKDKELNQ